MVKEVGIKPELAKSSISALHGKIPFRERVEFTASRGRVLRILGRKRIPSPLPQKLVPLASLQSMAGSRKNIRMHTPLKSGVQGAQGRKYAPRVH